MNLFFTILAAVIVGNVISEWLMMLLFDEKDPDDPFNDPWER